MKTTFTSSTLGGHSQHEARLLPLTALKDRMAFPKTAVGRGSTFISRRLRPWVKGKLGFVPCSSSR